MEITYNLEPGDLVQFYKYWWLKKKRITLWQVLALVMALLALDALPLSGHRHSISSSSLVILAVLFGRVATFRSSAEQTARETPGFVGLHTLAIGPDGIQHRSTVIEAKVKWHSVVDITEDDLLLYIFLSPSYPYIIPKRAFSSREEAEEFLNAARAYWKNLDQTLRGATATWPPPPRTLKP